MMPLLYDDVRLAVQRPDDPSPLRSFPVYEVSPLFPLMGDWAREKSRRVPRNPPFPTVWVEWKRPMADDCLSTMAVLLTALSAEWVADLSLPSYAAERNPTFYASFLFGRIDRDPHRRLGSPVGVPHTWPGTGLLIISDGGTSFDVLYTAAEDVNFLWRKRLAALPYAPDSAPEIYGPAIMAFALLHCRNVVEEVETPSSLRQKDRKREGKPRLTTYRTLRIEVPKTIKPRHAEDGGALDDGPQVRFHLCSGHFRELRSEKFTRKRGEFVWVTAHHRGSKTLGEVAGPRALTPGAPS